VISVLHQKYSGGNQTYDEYKTSVDSAEQVIGHDSPSSGEFFHFMDAERLENIEKAEKRKADD